MTTRGAGQATTVAAMALLAAEGLVQDTRRLGQAEGWEPPSASREPWRRRHKRRGGNGPGGPKVKLRIPGGRR